MTEQQRADASTPPQPLQQQQQQPPTKAEERTPEERLKALQEKTNVWKATVAEQLKEAAAKNKVLRDELRAAKAGGERELTELRVQLSREFKERTAMLQEEIATLHTQVAALRREKSELTATHTSELLRAEARGREEARMDLEREQRKAEEVHQAEVGKLTLALADKDKEVSQAEHEVSLLSIRLERLGEQYAELSSLINVDGAALKGGEPASGHVLDPASPLRTKDGAGLAQAVNDAAHQQQLESVRAELAGKEQQALRRMERAKAEHEQERQQLIREVQSREERLAVLQELLRQSQHELSGSQQRISRAQAERQNLEQHYAAKVSSLSQELATQLERLEEVQLAREDMERRLTAAKATIASLEEDAASREEAFHTLMLSEDDKQLVRSLEAATQAAREEAESWKLKFYQLQQPQPQQRRRRSSARHAAREGAATPQPPPSEGVSEDEDEAQRLLQLDQREAELAAQATQLEERAQALRMAEVKLEGIKKSVAQQASMILSKNGGGASVGGSNSSSGGQSGSSAAARGGSRWGATLRRPALYFDSLSEEQSWLKWMVHTLRWAVSTRLRVMLLVSCILIVFVLSINLVSSVAGTANPKDRFVGAKELR